MEQTILERTVGMSDSTTTYDTYYVYDDRGNLCYVLPPELSKTIEGRSPGTLPDTALNWPMSINTTGASGVSKNVCPAQIRSI